MISPDTRVPSHELVENKTNGNAYWSFIPDNPTDIETGLREIGAYGSFLETPGILEEAQQSGSVLVEGPPGAGKSHLVRELQEAAVIHNVPTFCLTTQINQGKRTGIQNIAEPFGAFRKAAEQTGGLVILDNIDMVGYKGGSKRRNAVAEYAQDALELVQEVTNDPKLVTVATGHDELWREKRWTWEDPSVDGPAQAVLESFGSRAVFEGKMTLMGLTRVLNEREYPLGTAARTVRLLKAEGAANFFHANHLDAAKFLVDQEAALAEIHAGREERRGR